MEREEAWLYHSRRAREELGCAYHAANKATFDVHMALSRMHMARAAEGAGDQQRHER